MCSDDARSVFEFWKATHCHQRARLDAKRQRRIQSRLREGFSVRDLKQAIYGAKFDDFLMGREARSSRVYDGLETLLRDAAQVERLIELYEKRRPKIAKRRHELVLDEATGTWHRATGQSKEAAPKPRQLPAQAKQVDIQGMLAGVVGEME